MKVRRSGLLVAALMAVSACGDLEPPNPSAALPVRVAPSPTPVAVLGTIPPLDCEPTIGTWDYVGGAEGVSDIVAETLTTPAVAHDPGDLIVVDGNQTAIVRDGRTIYVAEWRQADAGGWLLETTRTCDAAMPSSAP